MSRFISFFFILFLPLIIACERAPIKVGVLAPLTGKLSDIGIGVRQGAQMAAEEINQKGGIHGRKIVLVAENSFDTTLSGRTAVDHLLSDSDIVSVIGPALSQTAAQIKANIDAFDGVFVAPTVSSDAFTGQKDNLFRVNATTADRGRMLANYVATKTPHKRVTIIGDMANAAYVHSFNNTFMAQFQTQGGTIVEKINVHSIREPNWTKLIDSFDPSSTDAILINASAVNVAAFVRELRAAKIATPLLCPSWPFNRDLLLAAGRDLDGTIFVSTYDPTSTYEPYLAFKEKHHQRFGGGGMSFSTVFGYEAAHILFRALEETKGKKKGLHDALMNGGQFNGIYGDFALDEFGDVKRQDFLMTVKNGQYVKIDPKDIPPD